MAVTVKAGSMATVVRLEEEGSSYSQSHDNKEKNVPMGIKPTLKNPSSPFLSLTKPSWLVKTESNVRKEIRKKPEPPCVVCKGTGRVDCHHCSGKGRTNYVHLAMLPRGEWPKWCRTCGGSGLSYCTRCLGSGEYRYIMGFHFMNTTDPQDGPVQEDNH